METDEKKRQKIKQRVEKVFRKKPQLLSEDMNLIADKNRIMNKGSCGQNMSLRSVELAKQKLIKHKSQYQIKLMFRINKEHNAQIRALAPSFHQWVQITIEKSMISLKKLFSSLWRMAVE